LKITVITPCLNAAATIERTLESVAAQDHDDVEHVVVDGGSTDGTVALLERAGVRYVSEPDRGLSDAMNKGIAMATGDAIGWLNADDFYLPSALSTASAAFEGFPEAEWVTAPCLIVDEHDEEIRSLVTRYKRTLLRRYSFRSLLVQNFVAAPATFVRTDALRAVGGFDERFRYSMDYDVWLKLARRGDPAVVDQPLTAFRMAEGSLSMSGFERQFAEHAQNAREHGDGHRVAVAANQAMSRAIVLVYKALRARRQRAAA
jgi:glycosyltransferase involved in cell wall biosynthesis